MSGICAVWRSGAASQAAGTLAAITEGLKLAATEQTGQCVDGSAGVAVSARFPAQQLWQSPRVLIACDTDLRHLDELEAPGGRSQAEGTAAAVAALYERLGPDFVERLRGSFSLVLWDRLERKLIAAIDGFGIDRLVYYQDPDTLLVASRVDALLRSGEIDAAVNPRAIANLLNFSVTLGPETIATKVRRLQPGSMLVFREGHLRVTRYWDMRYGVTGEWGESRLSRKLESVAEAAVAANCAGADVSELGAFLSGGTDSSTVVGLMTRVAKGPVKAFSIGYQEQSFNELGYARLAAHKFQAKHFTYLVGPDDCFQSLPHMVRFFDEPFGNSSAIPTYFCARLAAENGVKILLAGDGGDELFGGNERYATDKIFESYHSVPRLVRRAVIEPVLNRLPLKGGLVGKVRRYVRRANLPPIERFVSFQFLSSCRPEEVFDADFCGALDDYRVNDVPTRYYREAPAREHLDRLLYVDVKMTLGDSDLPKVTRMCELAGMSVRFPFLDRRVAEFSGSIPARLKVKRFEKRYLFKRAFRDLLPAEIIRKKKHGFGIPVANWLKSDARFRELSRDVILSRRAAERGYFRQPFLEELFRRHEADESSYYGDILWTFLALELWHRQVVDEPVRTVA